MQRLSNVQRTLQRAHKHRGNKHTHKTQKGSFVVINSDPQNTVKCPLGVFILKVKENDSTTQRSIYPTRNVSRIRKLRQSSFRTHTGPSRASHPLLRIETMQTWNNFLYSKWDMSIQHRTHGKPCLGLPVSQTFSKDHFSSWLNVVSLDTSYSAEKTGYSYFPSDISSAHFSFGRQVDLGMGKYSKSSEKEQLQAVS